METFVLLTIALILAVLSFYLGFVYKGNPVPFDFFCVFGRQRSQVGFLVCLFLIGFIIYVIWNEKQASAELSEHIKPYNNIESSIWIPETEENNFQRWMFETSDSIIIIKDYYLSETNRKGWNIKADEKYLLVLEKDGFEMTIWITEKTDNKSEILYTLKKN